MTQLTDPILQNYIEGLSSISQFWGFPKGMGAIFAVLYISPEPLSLDALVERTGLTKGAISTNVRALARLGLVFPTSHLGDRKDYYSAETDFYKAIRLILDERKNSEFDRAIATVKITLIKLKTGEGSFALDERSFLVERIQAMQDFFDAFDHLTKAVARLDSLGLPTIQKVLRTLK